MIIQFPDKDVIMSIFFFNSFTNGNHHLVDDGGLINDDITLSATVGETNSLDEEKVIEHSLLNGE